MKLYILTAAAALLAQAAIANPAPYGCETRPIENSNAFQKVDPTCAAFAPSGGGGFRPEGWDFSDFLPEVEAEEPSKECASAEGC